MGRCYLKDARARVQHRAAEDHALLEVAAVPHSSQPVSSFDQTEAALHTPDTVVLEQASDVVLDSGETLNTDDGVTVTTEKTTDGGQETLIKVNSKPATSDDEAAKITVDTDTDSGSDKTITIDTAKQSNMVTVEGKSTGDDDLDVKSIFSRDSQGDNCEVEFERQQCDGLSCNPDSNTCDYCTSDSDCHTSQYQCSPSKHGSMFSLSIPGCDAESGAHQGCLCYHKQLLPIDHADIMGAAFTFIASTIAALAGIGGGGLLVPLYVLVMNFEADYASPLSSAAIMGGSMVGFIIYCQRWHERYPAIQRPLIDYETIALLIPALLAGVMIGTILCKVLPIWSILAVMFVLLITTTLRTGSKAYRLCVEDEENIVNETYAAEKAAAVAKPEEKQTVPDTFEGVFGHSSGNDDDENGAGAQPLGIGNAGSGGDPAPPYSSMPDNPATKSPSKDRNAREGNPGEVMGEAELIFDFKNEDKMPSKDPQLVAFEAPLDEGFGVPCESQVMDKMGEPLLSTDKMGDLLVGKPSLLGGKPLLTDEASRSLLQEDGGDGDDPLLAQAAVPITGTRFPGQLLGFIFLVWVTVIGIAVLKGGQRLQSPLPFVQCNDWGYWGVIACGVIILLLMQVWVRHLILYSSSSTQADIVLNRKNTLTVPLLSLPAGLIASLCGIGGGMVIGPILLELGARVSSVPATSTFVVLVTASSSTIQFVLTGNLPFFYAITFASLGGTGTLLGIYMQDFILKRSSNANFVIVLVITGILIASTCLMGYSGIRNVVRLLQMGGATFGLRNLCH